MKMLSLGGAIAIGLLTVAPTFAADMPLKAAPAPAPLAARWTGTYVGINGGYGWGTSNLTDSFGVSTGDFSQSGGMAGVTWGGNWQAGQWVLGFDTDWDWTDIKGSANSALCAGANCFSKVNWLSTQRMRAGIDLNGWLLYGTGGIAWGDVKAGCIATTCGDKTQAGWTAGVGVEVLFAPKWSAKLEYLHFDLGNNIELNPGFNPVRTLERGDTVKVGINYHYDMGDLFGFFR